MKSLKKLASTLAAARVMTGIVKEIEIEIFELEKVPCPFPEEVQKMLGLGPALRIHFRVNGQRESMFVVPGSSHAVSSCNLPGLGYAIMQKLRDHARDGLNELGFDFEEKEPAHEH